MVTREEHHGTGKVGQGVEQVSRYENGINGGVLSRPDYVVEAEEGLLGVNVTTYVQVGGMEEGERPGPAR